MRFQDNKEMLHGGDYNADQWRDRPDILAEDIRLMKKAGVNTVTLCVFSWSALEPMEDVYTFEWLDKLMDSMAENQIHVILSTPSGGKPPWMAAKHPDIMRTNKDRIRLFYGERENHCNSNLYFRKKVRQIDEKLASRYAKHPALMLWHISNEMYGQCHCDECQQNFRLWLKNKYQTIDRLNQEYWSSFWSHSYTDWSEISSPFRYGETAIHGLELDYQRFYSDLSIDFLKKEIEAVRKFTPEIPVTTNMFHLNCGIHYGRLSEHIDLIAWDSYPRWHCAGRRNSEWETAVSAAFGYDFSRSLQKKPFLLMESTPSTTNGFEVSKLKRPGMHMLSSMQAVACGADSVQYFQWRKSRGGYEKFHGAVISQNGSCETRVYREVEEVGRVLKSLSCLKGAQTKAEAAMIYDWDSLRALDEQKSMRRQNKGIEETMLEHYEALLKNYISVDIIDQTAEFSEYSLIAAPMLYMFLPGTAEKIRQFIRNGGTFVMTYYSGLVNENDLVYEGYPPYSLQDIFGVASEETDCLCDGEANHFTYNNVSYQATHYCDILQHQGAEVLSVYEDDFYKGAPVFTRKKAGEGYGCYLACRAEKAFLYAMYSDLINETGIRRITDTVFTEDVMVKERFSKTDRYQFFMNFSDEKRTILSYELDGYECKVIETKIL